METSAVRRVAALKNVVLPAFVLPISPTFSKNLQYRIHLWWYYISVDWSQP